MSEQIGKHKGAVETLLHEKKELSRILQIVNSQLQRHLSALEEAGVDTDEFIQQVQEGGEQTQRKQEQTQKRQKNRDKSNQRNESAQRNREQKDTEPEEDADELLEGENDVGNRDFNPNR